MFLSFIITSAFAFHFQRPEFHAKINSMQSQWVSGHNARWDTFTPESLKTQAGTFLDEPEFMKLPLLQEPLLDLILPEHFDAREQWPNCESIKEIRDQSTCGSCWAFGAAEAMSDRICIATGKQTRISTEDLLSCCGFTCGMGCNGGFPSGAWGFFKNKGLVTGNEYGNHNWCRSYSFPKCDHHAVGPYGPCGDSQKTPKCVQECHAESQRTYSSDKIHSISAYAVPDNQEAIKQEIYTYGPVEAAFTVYEDFLTYKSGVYHHKTGSQLGGHAVKIIGWGVENGDPYWLVANSWNEGWGDHGLFKIARGSNHLGIEGQVHAGRVV